ncbi:MAG: hypothetical protein ABSF44_12000 [Candidatus Bathyarchaeia archaeon]|jgi:hypothetical protein
MNIEWNSEEVNRDYPLWWNKGPFSYQFTATEEVMLEKAKAKWLDTKKEEQMMPRQRWAKALFTNEPLDRLPSHCSGLHQTMTRIFDGFADPPSILFTKDMINHPNLDAIGQMLWYAKFASTTDMNWLYNYGFGEELVTRKFRFIENGPPLAVEPFVRTKEDALFFLDNVPEPALRAGTWPIYFWEVKALMKLVPEMPIVASCCGGPITMAGFLRGIKDFVMDIRKNMELAELCLKGTTALLKKKIDKQTEILGQQIDDTGEGNWITWCDSTSYLTGEEFAKVFDITYTDAIKYCAKKGWQPEVIPEGPMTAHVPIAKCLSENGGGGMLGFSEHPNVDEWYNNTRKYDNIWAHDAFDNVAMFSPDYQNAIRNDFTRHAKLFMKYPTQGHRTYVSVPTGDPTIPLPAIEFAVKTILEVFKYPLQA